MPKMPTSERKVDELVPSTAKCAAWIGDGDQECSRDGFVYDISRTLPIVIRQALCWQHAAIAMADGFCLVQVKSGGGEVNVE
jgi:hypothetical protein